METSRWKTGKKERFGNFNNNKKVRMISREKFKERSTQKQARVESYELCNKVNQQYKELLNIQVMTINQKILQMQT